MTARETVLDRRSTMNIRVIGIGRCPVACASTNDVLATAASRA